MPADGIKISELSNVGTLSESALTAVTQENFSYNASVGQISNVCVSQIQHTELPTDTKSVLGALIEVAKGGAILTSPNGTQYVIVVSDDGTLSAAVKEDDV